MTASSNSNGKLRRKPMDLSYAKVPVGQVFIIPERCKECKFCVNFCPEKVLAFSTDINAKGYHYPIVVEGKENGCVHCGFCNLVCPEFAIYTEEIIQAEAAVEETA